MYIHSGCVVQTKKAEDSRTTTWWIWLDGHHRSKDRISSSADRCHSPCRLRGSEKLEHTMAASNALGRGGAGRARRRVRNRRTSGHITRGEKFWDCLDHPLVIQYAWGQVENTHRSTGSFILDDHRHRPRLSASHSIRHIRASRGVQASVRGLATWEAHALQCTLVGLRRVS